ncbi:MAG: DUF5103 domain-containing protein [Bacteroidota bacterium]
MKALIGILVAVFSAGLTFSQNAEYAVDIHLRYEDYTYLQNIRTVLLHKDLGDPSSTNDQLSDPIINLNTNDHLVLSFDDLDGGLKDLYYTFVHCDAHWQPTNMDIFDYIKGYTDDRITDNRAAFNTIQQYTHYNLSFPNDAIRLTKSGNYIILVYQDSDKEKLVLTRRFMIADRHVTIKAAVNQPSTIKDRYSKQQIDFRVFYQGYQIFNPLDELTVIIRQNGRWDNAIFDIKPVFLKDNELDYQYQDKCVFNGGNDYRFFDTRTLKIITERTARIDRDNNQNDVVLQNDPDRSNGRYFTNPDLNGKYFIHTQDGSNPDYECDYANIRFTLPYREALTTGSVFIFGALTDWNVTGPGRMQYDESKHAYEGFLTLKQGYYNYQYVFLADTANVPDETVFEGNHFEAENDYTIYVYDKPMGSRHDQLIGINRINTLKTY